MYRASRLLVSAVAFAGWPAALAGARAPASAVPSVPVATVPAGDVWAARSARFGGSEWITRPSRDTTMEFPQPLEIAEVAVTGGQQVKRGQVLVRAKDEEARAALMAQKLRAANDTEVRNARANLELAQSRFDAAEEAKKREAVAQAEHDERRIGLEVAKINVDAAEQRMKEEQYRAVQLEEQAKRFRLEAPFDGVIDQVFAELGQTFGENKPVVRIVAIDPMWIDVPIATDQTLTSRLVQGSPAWALLEVPGDEVVIPSRVLYVAPSANAASSTRLVRVEVPNRAGWPAGTRARVRFDAPGPEWKVSAGAPPAPAAGRAEVGR
ncbi:MAG: efflux RND transporter periplasmic adaptor subunit [Phycisphaerales bacterium]